VNENNVVDGDNFVSNGVVHVIDGVLLPTWILTALKIASSLIMISTLFSLLMTEIDLSDPAADPVTVVGPTNDAFALLDTADLEFLTSPEGLADLTATLELPCIFVFLPAASW
jgi:transforming growth factor-beta-induced protein